MATFTPCVYETGILSMFLGLSAACYWHDNMCTIAVVNNTEDTMSKSAVLKTLLTDYNKRISPRFNSPTADAGNLTVGIFVLSMGAISEKTMDYRMVVFLRQTWIDDRLSYRHLAAFDQIVLDVEMTECIWTPELIFINEKSAMLHTVTKPNKLMRIFPNGTVFYSMRLSVTLSCAMRLQMYPLDKQLCRVQLESFAYPESEIKLFWDMRAPFVFAENQTNDFVIGSNDIILTSTTVPYLGGNFTQIVSEFELTRRVGWYILELYIPCGLIVILSWVSFWLSTSAVAARVTLGVSTVLAITTQSSGASQSTPPVSYVKASDAWLVTCKLFVFAALVEFALVHIFMLAADKTKLNVDRGEKGGTRGDIYVIQNKNRPEQHEDQSFADFGTSDTSHACNPATSSCPASLKLDRASRIAFPACFVTFTAAYWTAGIYWNIPH